MREMKVVVVVGGLQPSLHLSPFLFQHDLAQTRRIVRRSDQ